MAGQRYERVEQVLPLQGQAGVDGLLSTLREILRLPKLLELKVDTKSISFTRVIDHKMEPTPQERGFSGVKFHPSEVIRRAKEVQEIEQTDVERAVLEMLNHVSGKRFYPVGWACKSYSFFKEHPLSCFSPPTEAESETLLLNPPLLGVPVLLDAELDTDVLVLLACDMYHANLEDTQLVVCCHFGDLCSQSVLLSWGYWSPDFWTSFGAGASWTPHGHTRFGTSHRRTRCFGFSVMR